MRILASLAAVAISVTFLGGCAGIYPDSHLDSEKKTLGIAASALPGISEYTMRSKIGNAEAARKVEELRKKEAEIEASETKARLKAAEEIAKKARQQQRVILSGSSGSTAGEAGAGGTVKSVSRNRLAEATHALAVELPPVVHGPPMSPEFSADTALLARREAYLKELKQASYTFNPPSPIKVSSSATVHLWLDPLADSGRLGEELKAALLKVRPGETPQIEAGRMDWSPRMRATLTGDDFDILPTEGKNFDGLKDLSATRRTEWSWDVKAKHTGQQLPLHLTVFAVLPKELGEPREVLKLDKLIHVEVTFLWLLHEYWDILKWILGGLGSALLAAIGAWWKSRKPKTEDQP